MKLKIGLFLICIIIFLSAGCSSHKSDNAADRILDIYKQNSDDFEKNLKDKTYMENKWDGDLEVYGPILAEYERVLKDKTYTQDKWKEVYDFIKRCIGKRPSPLYYCIKDLAEDGTSELILSVKNGEEYEPFIIYAFDSEGIKWACISEEYIMTVYKSGIVEYISGGFSTHYMYDQLQKHSSEPCRLATIVMETKDESVFYYKMNEDVTYEEISEKEFWDTKNQYTAVKEEFDWKYVEGFWNAEKTEK